MKTFTENKVDNLEKRVSELEDIIKNTTNSKLGVKLICHRRGKESKTLFYDKFDDDKIKKDFNVCSIFKCFTKNNPILHCRYYIDGITNSRHLVISDTYEKLCKDIIDIGMCE